MSDKDDQADMKEPEKGVRQRYLILAYTNWVALYHCDGSFGRENRLSSSRLHSSIVVATRLGIKNT